MAWAGWVQAHLGHGSAQDNTTLLGEGLLGAQQVVNEQRDAGKALTFQPVQVLQGRGTWGQQPPLLRGPKPWVRRGQAAGRKGPPGEKGREATGRQDLMALDTPPPTLKA